MLPKGNALICYHTLSLSTLRKCMHGDQARFVCRYGSFFVLWITGLSRDIDPEMTYCTQKATKPPEKNLACSSVQCSLAGLILQHWCASIKRNFNIIVIATQNENLFFNWPPMYIHTQKKKECFQLLSLKTFHKVSAVSYI